MPRAPRTQTKDVTPSAVTTHHADTKEDAARILCERYDNVHADMIGYFQDARGQQQIGADERGINAGGIDTGS